MIKKIILCCAIIGLFLSANAFAQSRIKVAVIPSVLNMFLQYAVLNGTIADEEDLLYKAITLIKKDVQDQGLLYSTKILESDSKSAVALIEEGVYPASQARYDADIIILIGNADEKEAVEVFFVGVESGRGYSLYIPKADINSRRFVPVLRETVENGLKRAEELIALDADKVINAEESIVQYRLPSDSDDILATIDYDPSQEVVENVYILIEADKSDGRHDFKLTAVEGSEITLSYLIEGGLIKDVDILTDLPDEEIKKTLSIKSRGGHFVNFTFNKKKDKKTKIKITPSINPYLPHLLLDS